VQWTDADRAQIAAQGTTVREVERQIDLFRRPPAALELIRPCALSDGIRVLPEPEVEALAAVGHQAQVAGRMSKFVPASGAASRMFQSLLAARASGAAVSRDEARRLAAEGAAGAADLLEFSEGLPRLPFREELGAALRRGGFDLDELVERGQMAPVLDHLLTPAGLDYAARPKGLLPFHRYAGGSRTPFEEHLVEAAAYTRARDGVCRVHFTVSPEHEVGFHALLDAVRSAYERRFDAKFAIEFSVQKPATDTIAVDLEDGPFRGGDGCLLFRPGGHGALIENLGDLGADIVFVKNIDNVVPEHRAGRNALWKQALAGVLVAVQAEVFRHLEVLAGDPDGGEIDAARRFAERDLSLAVPAGAAAARAFLREALDRPLRVCGVVRNVGEPGGGPFWVRDGDGAIRLQIIESAQVDPRSPAQQRIFASSSHFNPVDLVCGLRDHRGDAFDLHRFSDPRAVFIARKSSGGRELKALELPGLWNGAMALWNTIFVEVPLWTFNPVKTVLDLLRPEHQPASES
jgi:hypothetical protein